MRDDDLRDVLLERLDGLGVRCRPMFGGFGLYLGDRFFGAISDGRLYFRTDESSRPEYVERGMPALQPKHRPRGPKTADRNFEVPPEVFENGDELVRWALRAANAQP